MKIGRITLDGYCNYGNVLQSYALEQVLLRYADDVELIWHTNQSKLQYISVPLSWKNCIKFLVNYHGFRDFMKVGYYSWEIVRRANIKRFCDTHIHIRYDLSLDQVCNKYDFFVVGSDQVWNPYFENFDISFLKFVSTKKRIAYAASIGLLSIPNHLKYDFCKNIGEMAHISVREQSGAKLIEQLTGKKCVVTLDPTLLLSAEEWNKISCKPLWYDGTKYILTYFLGKTPDIVKHLTEIYKLKVINLLDKNNFDVYVTSPEEFIYLISHAELVYTDSFHGTVFSILFQRPFVCCNRIEKGGLNMTSRIDALLDLVNMQERRGTAENQYSILNPLEIVYPDVENILKQEREQSEAFIKRALNLF
ncbi:hypothetical protein BSR42_11130 [Megasphaera cerevisiae]|nr:hypothetical protein BSR42_11130 [Megasphaera cerevisiae]